MLLFNITVEENIQFRAKVKHVKVHNIWLTYIPWGLCFKYLYLLKNKTKQKEFNFHLRKLVNFRLPLAFLSKSGTAEVAIFINLLHMPTKKYSAFIPQKSMEMILLPFSLSCCPKQWDSRKS